jgi:hypothetical protein
MKKIAIAAIMALSAVAASAASVTVEGQFQGSDTGGKDSTNIALSVKESINNTFSADIGMNNYQQTDTKNLSTRLEAGVTGAMPIAGAFGAYTRVAVGEKFKNGSDFTYYSAEPGVTYTMGKATAKVGYRFRDSFTESFEDRTKTIRTGVSYAITAKDTVGVRYDQVRGSSQDSHSFNVAYTRGF